MIGIRDYSPITAPDPVLPPAGKTFQDQATGAVVTRITDTSFGQLCVHGYSLWDPFNADESMMLLFLDWDPSLFFRSANGWSHVQSLTALASAATPRRKLNAISAQWDPTDRNILYLIEATPRGLIGEQRVLSFDVRASRFLELRRFSSELPGAEVDELNMSASGHVCSFLAKWPDGKVAACVWDRWRDKLLTFPFEMPTPIHSTSISRCGQWLHVTASNPTPDLAFWRWADGANGLIVPVLDADKSDRGLLQHLYPGRLWLAAGRASDNSVVVRRWEEMGIAGAEVRELFRFRKPDGTTPNWCGYHTALRGEAETSVIVSSYGTVGAPGPGIGEVIEAGTDGTWFRRLARTGSAGKTYWGQPRASVSKCGRYCVWTSDNGGSERTDVYLMELPLAEEALAADELFAMTQVELRHVSEERDAARAAGDDLRRRMAAGIAALGTP